MLNKLKPAHLRFMLKITENTIGSRIDIKAYKSLKIQKEHNASTILRRIMLWLCFVLVLCMFLPWTQNIGSEGYLTTLCPEQRPQSIHSVIDGQIVRWYIREGQKVQKGDTIAQLREVKPEYFDPNLIERTENIANAKTQSIGAYAQKATALRQQSAAISDGLVQKLKQARVYTQQIKLKIISDSTDYNAQRLNLLIAKKQFERTDSLKSMGLKSAADVEEKRLKYQEMQAKVVSVQNKYLESKNTFINALTELNSLEAQYAEKIAKVNSDIQSVASNSLEAEAEVNKIKNQLANYTQRQKHYFLVAPQDGFVAKIKTTGVGEIIKAGYDVVTIMPAFHQLAAELYVAPMDLPLIKISQEVRLIFDGWPSLAISGWPELSSGTWAGAVVAIDQIISDNGKYRILVAPQVEDGHQWPSRLQVGAGVRGMALIRDVPMYRELWRQLNAFPPDYYSKDEDKSEKYKLKAPIKKIK